MPTHKTRKARARNKSLRRIAEVLQSPGGFPGQRQQLQEYRERLRAEKQMAK